MKSIVFSILNSEMKPSLFLLCFFLIGTFLKVSATDLGAQELFSSNKQVDIARMAISTSGVLYRHYDVSGQKFDWVLGTSILGTPGISSSVAGISLPFSRLPMGAAGLYAKDLEFDSFKPGLNGENGVFRESSSLAPLDSPMTEILWERGAFEGNAFRLDFRRQIVDSLRLDLGLVSYGNKNSDAFTYANVTHQPFFSLGRDSSTIPFGGRNISMNTMHLRPGVTWVSMVGEFSFHANLLFMDYDDVSRHVVVQDTSDYSIYHYATKPYSTSTRGQGYDFGLKLEPVKNLSVQGSFGLGNYEIEYENLPPMIERVKDTILELQDVVGDIYYDTTQDTTWKNSTLTREYETYSGEISVGYKTLFNPTLYFDFEFWNLNSKTTQDREIGYLHLKENFPFVEMEFFGGLQRNSSVNNEIEMEPTYGAELSVPLPFHLWIETSHRHVTRFPELEELRLENQGRLVYPNEDLEKESRYVTTLDLNYKHKSIFYGLGIRHEKAEGLIGERWLSGAGLESPEKAFQLVNFKEAETLDWHVGLGFAFSKWFLYGERGAVLERKQKLKNVPSVYYKGSVGFKDRFVNNRLGVELRLDYQWFGNRYDCGIVEDSIATYGNYSLSSNENSSSHLEIVELKKYLALDFEARMNILSFDLFARIENLNHSQYMPRVGYSPEGIRFAYGIAWKFVN